MVGGGVPDVPARGVLELSELKITQALVTRECVVCWRLWAGRAGCAGSGRAGTGARQRAAAGGPRRRAGGRPRSQACAGRRPPPRRRRCLRAGENYYYYYYYTPEPKPAAVGACGPTIATTATTTITIIIIIIIVCISGKRPRRSYTMAAAGACGRVPAGRRCLWGAVAPPVS